MHGQRSKCPVVETHKTWVFVSGENARLDELIALLGCGSEIASIDSHAFLRRAGEVIARATAGSRRPKRVPKQAQQERERARKSSRVTKLSS
jgi:hypothetical protein